MPLHQEKFKGVVEVALYVDDNLMVGDVKAIDDNYLSHWLVLKVVEGLQDYLSCEIKFSKDKKWAWLGQPHLVKNLEKKFGECVQTVWSHKSLGMSKFLIARPTVDSKKISMEDQWEYWSGVGISLCLVKHSCPDLANVTREWSKANSGTNPAAYKEHLHLIKYFFRHKEPWTQGSTHWDFQQTLVNYLL